MLKAVLFDLDGTLLPMDQDKFVNYYFGLLCKKLAPYGYEPKALIRAVWGGTEAMVKNDGSCRNEEAFWRYFLGVYGPSAREHVRVFEDFYANEFQQARAVCGFAPEARETVELAKALGLRVILATNPLFPAVATESRIRWAGLSPEDFEFYTTYENSSTCKPNPAYYGEILQKRGLSPEECLMVGNDADEDTAAAALGLSVFLLTDCLIDRSGRGIGAFPHGDFARLAAYLCEKAGAALE